ncbi:MAG: hypothetical protein A4E66_02270 [Syntrophus sp. PtaB.Bin001]|nr:MAG: hypothetical protein A4E66_02270 [Syntrophus sp. PtaB.Bin001]
MLLDIGVHFTQLGLLPAEVMPGASGNGPGQDYSRWYDQQTQNGQGWAERQHHHKGPPEQDHAGKDLGNAL